MKGLLDEFGLQWTQLAILAGVGISTFGLERYVAAGPWIFGAVAGLAAAKALKPYIRKGFVIIALRCIALVAVAAGLTYAALDSMDISFAEVATEYRPLFSATLGAVSAALAGVLTLSYRLDSADRPPPFPADIDVVMQGLLVGPLYRDYYRVTLRYSDLSRSTVNVETDVSYILVNRSSSAATVKLGLIGKDASKMSCTYARIRDHFFDPDDLQYNTAQGFLVPTTVAPGESVLCNFRGTQKCYVRDSDVYTSYYPTSSFELRIVNPFPERLRVLVVPWGPSDFERVEEDGDAYYRSPEAFAPYTGARIHWTPTGSQKSVTAN